MSKIAGKFYTSNSEGMGPLTEHTVTCCERWQAEIKRLRRLWKLSKEVAEMFAFRSTSWQIAPPGWGEEPPFLYCPECGSKLKKEKT